MRIQRVQRDIPVNLIVAGVKKSNLRELLQDRLQSDGKKCNCIRCREEGLLRCLNKQEIDYNEFIMHRMDYEASEGQEIFRIL